MTGYRIVLRLAACLVILTAGCGEDPAEQSSYSGVGKLVADRNQARLANAGNRRDQERADEDAAQGLKARPSRPIEVITEEDVRIVSTASGETLARATLFMDKNGRIINIRLRKD